MYDSDKKGGDRMVMTLDGVKYAFRWCPPGELLMGSNDGSENERPSHGVKLTYGFWMLETNVTQEMWESVMEESVEKHALKSEWNHKLYGSGPNYPMYYVNWFDSQEFCIKIKEKFGHEFRIPYEAEWEYACWAGEWCVKKDLAEELDSTAWYFGNSDKKFHEVGQKKPNAWGLREMVGTTWEWCLDFYSHDYYTWSPKCNPVNCHPSSSRVIRGGSLGSDADVCRPTSRTGCNPEQRNYDLGMRVVFAPDAEFIPGSEY